MGTAMNDTMNRIMSNLRSGKGPAVAAIIALAIMVEVLDAGLGITAMASSGQLATEGMIGVADVIMGLTAAWLIRL